MQIVLRIIWRSKLAVFIDASSQINPKQKVISPDFCPNRLSTGYYRRSRHCVPRFSRWNWCRRNACDARHDVQTDGTFVLRTQYNARKASSMKPYRCWVMYVVDTYCYFVQFYCTIEKNRLRIQFKKILRCKIKLQLFNV